MADSKTPLPYTPTTPSLKHPYKKRGFTISSETISSLLVSTDQLKSHLKILGMINPIKHKIENSSSNAQFLNNMPLLAKVLIRATLPSCSQPVTETRRWHNKSSTANMRAGDHCESSSPIR